MVKYTNLSYQFLYWHLHDGSERNKSNVWYCAEKIQESRFSKKRSENGENDFMLLIIRISVPLGDARMY